MAAEPLYRMQIDSSPEIALVPYAALLHWHARGNQGAIPGKISVFHGIPRDTEKHYLADLIWCERGDSNPHAVRRWNLNPVRLPIPPLSQSSVSPFDRGQHQPAIIRQRPAILPTSGMIWQPLPPAKTKNRRQATCRRFIGCEQISGCCDADARPGPSCRLPA